MNTRKARFPKLKMFPNYKNLASLAVRLIFTNTFATKTRQVQISPITTARINQTATSYLNRLRQPPPSATGRRLVAPTSAASDNHGPPPPPPPGPVSKEEAVVLNTIHIMNTEKDIEDSLNQFNLRGVAVDFNFVNRVIGAFQSPGDNSLKFFNWVMTQHPEYQPTSVELNEFVKTLAFSHQYEFMWRLIEQMKTHFGVVMSSATLCSIIEYFGSQGLTNEAVEFFNRTQKIFNFPHSLEVYNSLLYALCEVKLFEGAYALVRRMLRKSMIPDMGTYTILVNAWCATGKLEEAQAFLDSMSRKGFNPPMRGRDMLIEGLLRGGQVESTKQLVINMARHGFSPRVSSFNYLVEEIIRTGDEGFCFDLYDEVCFVGMHPNIDTYKLLIPVASMGGRIDDVFSLLRSATKDGRRPFVSMYAPIIKSVRTADQFDEAESFFNEMMGKELPLKQLV